jgi:hypothetical protein
MVVVCDGRVIESEQVKNIDFRKCLLISFNQGKIVFYDFTHGTGGADERD